MSFFRIKTILIASIGVIALSGAAVADDHLLNALDHGLTLDSQPFQENKTGHSAEVVPGQGSPFFGGETHTPSSVVASDKHPDKIKERTPK